MLNSTNGPAFGIAAIKCKENNGDQREVGGVRHDKFAGFLPHFCDAPGARETAEIAQIRLEDVHRVHSDHTPHCARSLSCSPPDTLILSAAATSAVIPAPNKDRVLSTKSIGCPPSADPPR